MKHSYTFVLISLLLLHVDHHQGTPTLAYIDWITLLTRFTYSFPCSIMSRNSL